MPDTLVIMAKKPQPGAVKTRLARRLGDEATGELYRAFLRDLHQRFAAAPWRLLWAVHPPGSDLAADLEAEVECIDQRGATLAERMWNLFADLFGVALAEAGRVVMIGADVPHLEVEEVAAAFSALERSDVVLKPTRDGGYCLIGLRRAVDLFTGIPMSTAEVFRRTLERARSLGLQVEVQPEGFDIDELADLHDLAEVIRRGAVQLPFTAAVLGRVLPRLPAGSEL